MATYRQFITLRAVEPDPVRLIALLRGIDPSIGVQHQSGDLAYTIKRSGDVVWSDADIQTAQTILDTAPAFTPVTATEARIDHYPPEFQAMLLVLLDQINVLRVRAGLIQVTTAQAIQAIKDKLATIQFRP